MDVFFFFFFIIMIITVAAYEKQKYKINYKTMKIDAATFNDRSPVAARDRETSGGETRSARGIRDNAAGRPNTTAAARKFESFFSFRSIIIQNLQLKKLKKKFK